MTNFFNAIGVADMERVHSAVIGWMLSDGCTAFSRQTKSDIINTMFGQQPSRVFSQISVFVEVYNIDILIVTKDASGNEECWVIENKIKSNQHHNQLDKYVGIIKGSQLTKGKNSHPITGKYKKMTQHYCFFTLIDETPQGKNSNLWKNFRYTDLEKVLSNKLPNNIINSQQYIINEYVACLNEMNDALLDFLQNPAFYPHVFTDGNKKKAEKDEQYLQKIENNSGKFGRYISECGLETIFQKCYLGEEWKKYLKKTQKKYYWGIYETRGNAALDIGGPTIEDKTTNEKYNTQIEFQNGTFKVQITPFDNSKITKNVFINKWGSIGNMIKTSNSQKLRVNLSKSNNNSIYMSLSFQVKDWWKFSNLWTNIGACEKLLDELIKKGNCVKAP